MKPIGLPARPSILVVALRRLGDVLLTTPLIRSLRRAYPDASITALVFSGTEGILAGNPDLDAVSVMPARSSASRTLALAWRSWRRFDLAVSTQTGDRPTFFAWAAARQCVGLVEASRRRVALKPNPLDRCAVSDPHVHRVTEILRLADVLGVTAAPAVVCPTGPTLPGLRPDRLYAVIHVSPIFHYKRWIAQGWRDVADELMRRGLTVIATGSPLAEERRYLDDVWAGIAGVQRRDGQLDWPGLAALISGAQVYVGPDTSVTHLAAATGCPTVALYGPTDPRRWGPWPAGGLDQSWAASDSVQRRHNVWLVQKALPCQPCQREGCERRLDSYSRCLDEMTAADVMAGVNDALAWRASRSC